MSDQQVRRGVLAAQRDETVRAVYDWAVAQEDASVRDAALIDQVRLSDPLLTAQACGDVAEAVRHRLYGLGPLEVLLQDPHVTEIMVNGPGPVWVERSGTLAATDLVLDRTTIELIVERVIMPLGLRADRTAPLVDARLPDGSRVNAVMPPLAVDGPYVTIRRFATSPFPLTAFAAVSEAEFLAWAVQARLNIMVSGGTGAGKTSLLNALAMHLDAHERVVTVEDAAELRLPGDHVVRLESRPANAEGVGEVPIRTLVRNALRMRPDRILVGEVRGPEALDMIQAMTTGHEGSLSTCHANSPDDALRRLETMVLMNAMDLPLESVRESLRTAIDLVVQMERTEMGGRRVASICLVDEHGCQRFQPDLVDPVGATTVPARRLGVDAFVGPGLRL